MASESINLLERIRVNKSLNPLQRGHLALGVLFVDRRLATASRLGAARLENIRFSSGGAPCCTLWLGIVGALSACRVTHGFSSHQRDLAYLSRVDQEPALPDETRVLELLEAAGFRWPAPVCVSVTESTNLDARALAVAGAPHGTSVVAAEQTAGRGRHGRPWVSTRGAGLWCSVLLRGSVTGQSLPRIPLVSALAVVDAVQSIKDVPLGIKWPNDVLSADGQKLAGILAEATPDTVVVGIGINVRAAPSGVQDSACCLVDLGVSADLSDLLAALLLALYGRLNKPWTDNLADYRQVCRTLGSDLHVTLPGGQVVKGVGLDVDPEGHLLVKTGRTVQTIIAGDVLHATIAP